MYNRRLMWIYLILFLTVIFKLTVIGWFSQALVPAAAFFAAFFLSSGLINSDLHWLVKHILTFLAMVLALGNLLFIIAPQQLTNMLALDVGLSAVCGILTYIYASSSGFMGMTFEKQKRKREYNVIDDVW